MDISSSSCVVQVHAYKSFRFSPTSSRTHGSFLNPISLAKYRVVEFFSEKEFRPRRLSSSFSIRMWKEPHCDDSFHSYLSPFFNVSVNGIMFFKDIRMLANSVSRICLLNALCAACMSLLLVQSHDESPSKNRNGHNRSGIACVCGMQWIRE